VFRETGKRRLTAAKAHLAAFVESLPTDIDRKRFLDAARLFLSFDLKTRNLSAARRTALVYGPITSHAHESAILSELWEASRRLLAENGPPAGSSDENAQLSATRLLIARLVVAGILGAADRRVLLDATLLLRELTDRAQRLRSAGEGKSGRRDALSETSPQRALTAAQLRAEAEQLRKDRPHLRSKRDRARKINERFKRNGRHNWPNHDALIEFARRNKIKI
jgi:hypothetical protein